MNAYTLHLTDTHGDDNLGPWLRTRYRASVRNAEGRVVATLYTDDVEGVNGLANRFANLSGECVPCVLTVFKDGAYTTLDARLTYVPERTLRAGALVGKAEEVR